MYTYLRVSPIELSGACSWVNNRPRLSFYKGCLHTSSHITGRHIFSYTNEEMLQREMVTGKSFEDVHKMCQNDPFLYSLNQFYTYLFLYIQSFKIDLFPSC